MELVQNKPVKPKFTRASGGGRKATKTKEIESLKQELLIRAPQVPSSIKDDNIASEQFKTFASILVKRRVLKEQHLPQLCQLCKTFSIYQRNIEACEKEGYTIMSNDKSKGMKTNPRYIIAMRALDTYRTLCSLFMLDPTSENRFGKTEEFKEEANPFASFK